MKLVKIDSDLYLNTDFIEAIEVDGEGSTDITMKNGEVFSPNVPIKKVLDAISGSEEHLVFDPKDIYLKSSQKKK
ncbi:hypothetical protein GQS62_03905 [Pediococcus pentosaceus]|uniref:hypothetical protein n=1 Tax=Pediococcus pentosaceus TaxID=1255 RepID=UPI00130355FE|nr:hypothetical protein [Pediococcus pentosaceus]QGZ69999.1 hypothetical protein GQS62_03905 [Pediococcus pentosaceus]